MSDNSPDPQRVLVELITAKYQGDGIETVNLTVAIALSVLIPFVVALLIGVIVYVVR